MPAGTEILSAVRITRVVEAIQDAREKEQPLLFSSRIPNRDTTEDELIGRMIGRPQIADLVADDAEAVTYSYGKASFETFNVSNIKHGRQLTQVQINQLLSLQGSAATNIEDSPFAISERSVLKSLIKGIRLRVEALKVAMLLDGFTYNRLGIQMSGVSWGMPDDLKVTPSNAWTDHTNGDPVGDLMDMQLYARIRYGVIYNRATMSTPAFRHAIQCAKFQAQAKLFIPPQVDFSVYMRQNLAQQKSLFEAVSGFQIVLTDERYFAQDNTGAEASTPFLPLNKVIVDSTDGDGSEDKWYFGNVPTTESQISRLAPSAMVGNLSGSAYGPIGYATVPPNLNPPNITYWAVARGWPRKVDLFANGYLTIGTITDPVPVGEPFTGT